MEQVFAPQYPTWKGKVLGQLWYFSTSETILIDLKLDIMIKNAEKISVSIHGKFEM